MLFVQKRDVHREHYNDGVMRINFYVVVYYKRLIAFVYRMNYKLVINKMAAKSDVLNVDSIALTYDSDVNLCDTCTLKYSS